MKDLIKLEYKKIWNGITITAIAALCIITTVLPLITLNIQHRTLDQDGNLVTGLPSFRALKEESADLEGIMDGEYLQNLVEKYNASLDKSYLEENRGFMGTGGMTKYMVTNYVINYAYYGPYMSNGNEKMGLDYGFLNSEESFYRQYKEAVLEHLLYVNEINGLFPYSEEQIEVLEEKVENIKTPFRVEYMSGLSNMVNYLGMEYLFLFVLLAFCISSVYAKDSTNGMDELALSSRHGRKKDMTARWIAGNLFAVTVYLIFIGLLAVVHGIIATLHGWNSSAQTFWFSCLYSFSFGTGLLITFFGGLAGALVMANIVMLLSMILKNSKAATIAGVIIVFLLRRQASTYSQIKLFNPFQFKDTNMIESFLFIGKTFVPYFVIVFVLSVVYIAVCQLLMMGAYKKYRIN